MFLSQICFLVLKCVFQLCLKNDQEWTKKHVNGPKKTSLTKKHLTQDLSMDENNPEIFNRSNFGEINSEFVNGPKKKNNETWKTV